MPAACPFARVAVLGTGLIGGSFALALRQCFPGIAVTGWDRAEVLALARECGAVDEGATDLAAAVRGADLIYLALPAVRAMDLLGEIARQADPRALVTDTSSTKAAIVRAARARFPAPLRFLGGHPIAGKELRGIENADAELFRGAKYVLVAPENDPDPRVAAFGGLVRALGAKPVWCDAETHDWAVAVVSHLPQLVSTALAAVVLEETDDDGMPLALAGPGLRDMTRLAGSPYEVWRDVCLTNRENIARGLDRVGHAVERLRLRLASRELEEDFTAANALYKILRELQ